MWCSFVADRDELEETEVWKRLLISRSSGDGTQVEMDMAVN
jgi:hypothetical protein